MITDINSEDRLAQKTFVDHLRDHSESAWVDVVWFDNRIPLISLGVAKPKMRVHPALPVVAFEIELKTGLNAKHIKGSVSNPAAKRCDRA